MDLRLIDLSAAGARVVVRCVTVVLALAGCGFDPFDRCSRGSPGSTVECPMPGWLDRAFTLHVPPAWDRRSELPLLYVFHGGGGNRDGASRVTCPGGARSHADCLPAKATAAGYVVVLPDGTGTRPIRNSRSWNAGGGRGEWQCVSGPACRSGADDLGYLDELHTEVARIVAVDPRRVYATGLSNGAAMSHRYACERPARLAAIAAVGGNNQHAAAGGACAAGVAVLQIHGTKDPCWFFSDSTEACAQRDGKRKVGVEASLGGWRARNGCGEGTTSEALADTADDGTRSERVRWQGCAGDVELVRIEGGGHTWPQGFAYLPADVVGPVGRDFDADDIILEFFGAHVR